MGTDTNTGGKGDDPISVSSASEPGHSSATHVERTTELIGHVSKDGDRDEKREMCRDDGRGANNGEFLGMRIPKSTNMSSAITTTLSTSSISTSMDISTSMASMKSVSSLAS